MDPLKDPLKDIKIWLFFIHLDLTAIAVAVIVLASKT